MRRILSWWAGLLAVLGGCGTVVGGIGCVGVYAPPPHPTVQLTTAYYKSPASLRPRDTIEVLAYTTGPATREGTLELRLNNNALCNRCGNPHGPPSATATLHDDGKDGDLKSGDGEWYGKCTWPGGESCTLSGSVHLFFARYDSQWLLLPDLTIKGEDPHQGEAAAPTTGGTTDPPAKDAAQ